MIFGGAHAQTGCGIGVIKSPSVRGASSFFGCGARVAVVLLLSAAALVLLLALRTKPKRFSFVVVVERAKRSAIAVVVCSTAQGLSRQLGLRVRRSLVFFVLAVGTLAVRFVARDDANLACCISSFDARVDQ